MPRPPGAFRGLRHRALVPQSDPGWDRLEADDESEQVSENKNENVQDELAYSSGRKIYGTCSAVFKIHLSPLSLSIL